MPRHSGLLALFFLIGAASILAQDPVAEGPSVLESAICHGIEDRLPVAEADTFEADVDRIFCWTRISGAAGANVVHAWIHDGVTRARVELAIGSEDWRTYSSKRILPAWTGDWEVKVLTHDGAVLATLPFHVR